MDSERSREKRDLLYKAREEERKKEEIKKKNGMNLNSVLYIKTIRLTLYLLFKRER